MIVASPGSAHERVTCPLPGAAARLLGADGAGCCVKVTFTVVSAVTAAVQVVPVPEQPPPLQALTAYPEAGDAVSAIEPPDTLFEQSPVVPAPQSIPEPVTEPPAAGETSTVSLGGRNNAPTVVAPETTTVQDALLSDEHSPLHFLNSCPAAGEAVSETSALFVTVSEQSPAVPAPQAMPVPVTEPFVGVGEIVRVTRPSSIDTSASFTFSFRSPSDAEPFTFTVSPPSATESAVGVKVNVPDAFRSPPGIEIVKLETAPKSVPSVAVPPFTFTFTDFDAALTDLPVSFAFTCTVRAPPSSGTAAGLTLKTTFGSQRSDTSALPTVESPESWCVTTRR